MDDKQALEIPASIALAWGTHLQSRKGPKRGLSVERIVEVAIRIALSEGLAAVSMSRVASDLGTGAMSLYRYVDSKDELLTLMLDTALGVPLTTIDANDGWRAGLLRWVRAIRATYARHTWALRIPISGPPISPNQVAWVEVGLRLLGETNLSEAEKLSVIMLLSGFVRNEATQAATMGAASLAAGSTAQENQTNYGRVLARLLDPLRFPALHAAIASGALSDADGSDTEFEFGLACILNGVEALVQRRAGNCEEHNCAETRRS
jgi:AcrR family transcriptional regulator